MIGRVILAALVIATATQADTLHLRNGSTIQGSFLGGTGDDVRFLVNDQVRHYARAEVAEIVFGSASAPSNDREDVPKIDLGPDVANAPFMRGANGYIPLERAYAMMARSGGMYGMGGTVYRIQGSRSPVRVRQGDRIVFVVRITNGSDPRQFQLFRLESRMGYRQTQPTMGGAPPGMAVNINKISDSVYEIVPARPLYPGEYSLSPLNSNDSYCFGMDY